jgi:hypothetical protein
MAAEAFMRAIPLLAIIFTVLSSVVAAADDAQRYVAPPPTGDPQSTIVSGILMIVNGVIMAEADRRHQECATFVSGLHQNGFPVFRHACRIRDENAPQRR